MGCFEECLQYLKEFAYVHEPLYYIKVILFWNFFFAFVHWIVESLCLKWN